MAKRMRWLLVAVCLSLFVLSAPAGANSRQTPTGVVTLVHGVRGLVADVYLDGKLVLPAFQPERATDPLTLPAGDHAVDIRTAGSPADSAPLLHGTLTVKAGIRQSAIVHLSEQGTPAVTAYDDDLSTVPATQTRVVLRHAAAAPPIDVTLNGSQAVSGLANGREAEDQVVAGTYAVAVSTGGQALLAPTNLPLAEGVANFMYLIGSRSSNSLTWLALPVTGAASAPAAVNTGQGGAAAPPAFPYPLVAVLSGLAIISLGWLARRRPTR
jgi:Domain of unknown function (DUF4397)